MITKTKQASHETAGSGSQRSLKYRPDIDGLRAIAVIAVVLFHAFPNSILRSGFVGVDIFFVISGFLISTIIFRGMNERMSATGTARPFSFTDFYARRIRRIFPSLIFCLLTFLVLGWFFLLPGEFSLFGKHTAGASAYVSNLVLWHESGDYFENSSQTKPLLHLWSLGIEEQFYLIWPLVLYIAYRLKINILVLAAAGALASFGFEIYTVQDNPPAAFYSPFFRFWELMAGSILAWLYKSGLFAGAADRLCRFITGLQHKNYSEHDGLLLCSNVISVLGLSLIAVSVFCFSSKGFPGYKAIFPVSGAVLMIAAGKDAFLNRYLLSNRAMVWIGLISYPLYIWHWPFLSFAWIIEGGLPQLKVRIACVILAVVMSAVTYYFVEPKLRWGRFGGYKAAGLLSAMIVVGVTGYSIMRHDGYAARMNNPDLPVLEALRQKLEDGRQRCADVIPDWNLSDGYNQCRFQHTPGENAIAVIGDSHAQHLYAGLISKNRENESVVIFSAPSAIPLMGLHSDASPKRLKVRPNRAHTEHLLSEGFSYILSHKNITKVVLSHSTMTSWQNVVDTKNPGNHDFVTILRDGFARTYNALAKAGKEVYVVLDNPVFTPKHWAKCNSSVTRRPSAIPAFLASENEKFCSIKEANRLDRKSLNNWNRIAREQSAGYKNVHFIDLSQVFCQKGICSMIDDKRNLLYLDNGHLNIKGSIYAAPFILEQLKK